jgi:ATP-dependent Clp protease ATP-binding subunit ClpC
MHDLLFAAAGEAQALNHEYIGTEHLLLALLAAPESCGATALGNLRVDLVKTRNRVLAIVHAGKTYQSRPSAALLPLTTRAKTVLALAGEEARSLNHTYTGTEHLLLGLLAEGKGIAAQVLFEAGVALPRARAEVLRIVGVELEPAGNARAEVPTNEAPSRVAVVLEYGNGAVVSKHFATTREAIAFLQTK